MKRLAVTLVVLGLVLMKVGLASSQGPGGQPPPRNGGDDRPPPHEEGRNRPRDGNQRRADGQENTNITTTVSESSEFLDLTPAFTAGLLGGDHTVFDFSIEAFTNPLSGYSESQLEDFEAGDEFFEQSFVASNGIVEAGDDGLGPLFNANSCESCHTHDGRGRALQFPGESETGFLIRLARNVQLDNGATLPDPIYGGQFQDFAIDNVASEGAIVISYAEITGNFADGTPFSLRQPFYQIDHPNYGDIAPDTTFSPRVANQMIGLGLLEAVPESTILAFADPDDSNGDGVSGRPNWVWDVLANDMALGRFGWKAGQPSLLQQSAGAFSGDMGLTTSLFPEQSCTASQPDCTFNAHQSVPEVPDEVLEAVAFYSSSLAVPAQRDVDDPMVQQGAQIFAEAQCSACHISQMQTGSHEIPQLAGQTIQPYTDLLLHDMGPGLADGQLDFVSDGTEWRTAPLWGIGLFETVNGHTTYLHDGRARNLSEAILWHGGEAQNSRDYFVNLSAAQRNALLAFLESL